MQLISVTKRLKNCQRPLTSVLEVTALKCVRQSSAALRVIPYVKGHVGVALLNAVPPTQSGNTSSGTPKDEALKLSKSKKSKPEVSDLNGESSSRGTAVSRSDSASHSAGNRHLAAAEMKRQRLIAKYNTYFHTYS
ncbi:hypothetical protein OIU76_024158 [Salix suchowensis]|nr:hypothetical protein OIU76_024158 [Salix suchowensis]